MVNKFVKSYEFSFSHVKDLLQTQNLYVIMYYYEEYSSTYAETLLNM